MQGGVKRGFQFFAESRKDALPTPISSLNGTLKRASRYAKARSVSVANFAICKLRLGNESQPTPSPELQ